MVDAVAADVEVRPAARTLVPEPDSLARRQLQGPAAREAFHGDDGGPRRAACQGASRYAARVPARLDARPVAAAALCVLLGSSLAAPPASAQARPGEAGLSQLALLWALGEYAEPVICTLEKGPVRGARTVVIRPQRRSGHRPLDVVEVRPLDLPDGLQEGCRNDLGAPEPEMQGVLHIGLSRHHRPDTAQRDFQQALRDDGGFDFEISKGRLEVHDEADGPRQVDLAGGTARLEVARPGTDAARLLGDAGERPKRVLTLEGPEGDRFVFHLVLLRPPR